MRLTVISAIASVILAAALLAVFVVQDSVLAAAQAADSAADVLVAVGLAVALFIASRPADNDHHYGHGQAEPVAALVAAFVAGQLGIEVIQTAIESLRGAPLQALSATAAAVFAAKVAVKIAIAVVAFRGRKDSAVLDALAIDARNDILVGCVALAGFFAVNAGYGRLDAILALAIGAFIVYSAFGLALRSIKLLMGEAPPPDRLVQLRLTAADVEGVVVVEDLRARMTGDGIAVSLCVGVGDHLTVEAAHEIADSVEGALEALEDVSLAEVHIHPASNRERPGGSHPPTHDV